MVASRRGEEGEGGGAIEPSHSDLNVPRFVFFFVVMNQNEKKKVKKKGIKN